MKKCLKCGTEIGDNAGDLEERFLNVFANFTMILGIIISTVMAFTIIFVEKESSYGDYSFTHKEFSPIGLSITISTLIVSILLPILLKIFVNISSNIRLIANKNK